MDKELLKGHLPVLILGVLQGKPMHGYAICEALQSGDGVKLDLGEGTVYPLLHRLETQGHVKSRWTVGETGKKRKVYEITRSGAKLIAAHKAEIRKLSELFNAVFGEDWTSA